MVELARARVRPNGEVSEGYSWLKACPFRHIRFGSLHRDGRLRRRAEPTATQRYQRMRGGRRHLELRCDEGAVLAPGRSFRVAQLRQRPRERSQMTRALLTRPGPVLRGILGRFDRACVVSLGYRARG